MTLDELIEILRQDPGRLRFDEVWAFGVDVSTIVQILDSYDALKQLESDILALRESIGI